MLCNIPTSEALSLQHLEETHPRIIHVSASQKKEGFRTYITGDSPYIFSPLLMCSSVETNWNHQFLLSIMNVELCSTITYSPLFNMFTIIMWITFSIIYIIFTIYIYIYIYRLLTMVIQHLGIGGWTKDLWNSSSRVSLLCGSLWWGTLPGHERTSGLRDSEHGRYGKIWEAWRGGKKLRPLILPATSSFQKNPKNMLYKPVSLPDKKHVRKCDHTVRMASDFAKHKPLSQQRCSW